MASKNKYHSTSSTAAGIQERNFFTPLAENSQNKSGRQLNDIFSPLPSGFDDEGSKKRRLSDSASTFLKRELNSIPSDTRNSALTSSSAGSASTDRSKQERQNDGDLSEEDIVTHRNGQLLGDDDEDGGTVKV